MTKFERRVFTLSNLAISLIGILYLIYKYFFVVDTDYGERPHQFTSDLLHLHIITVPLLVLLVGYLYSEHIYPKLKSKKNKRKKSGILIIATFIAMSLSGYVLQVSTEGLSTTGIIHSAVSVVWIVATLWHHRLKF
jgi:uncharacterized membrane protein